MSRLVIAIQHYHGDAPQAARLVRLITDAEREPRSDVELCIVRRFDTEPDTDSLIYAASKFKVSCFKTSTPWTGWPGGCNGVALDLLKESDRRVKSGEWADVDGLLMIEPDCVPCVPDWIDQIRVAWLRARMDSKIIMGSWRNSGGPDGHINGNCVVMPDLASVIGTDMIGPGLAWDCALTPYVKDKWAISSLFKNMFQSKDATEYDLKTPESGAVRPVLVHGYKDTSAIEIAEGWLKL